MPDNNNAEKLKDFDSWLQHNTLLRKNSRKQYILQINKFLNTYKEENLNNFRSFLLLTRKGRIVYHRKVAVKKYLQFTNRQGWINELTPIMKALKLQNRRYERYISFDHFKELLDHLMISHKKLTIALMMLWDTGMRISPIINLKVKDIREDLDGHYITVVEKGGKLRNRYLDDHTVKLLREIIKNRKPDDYVFREKIKNRWETWWECYYRLWKILKMTSRDFLKIGHGISFHWIRTSRAKQLYK